MSVQQMTIFPNLNDEHLGSQQGEGDEHQPEKHTTSREVL